MTFFHILAAIHTVFIGAIYGRLDGGGITKTHEWVERSLIMFFFVLACAPFAGLWAIVAYIGVLGIATGHGQYFVSLTLKAIEPEKVDFLVSLIFGRDPRTNEQWKGFRGGNIFGQHKEKLEQQMKDYGLNRLYWRCAFGMFCTGFLVGLPSVILSIIYGQYWAAALFAQTGTVKAIAYVLSDKIGKGTEGAEYINGGLRNTICCAVIFVLLSGSMWGDVCQTMGLMNCQE